MSRYYFVITLNIMSFEFDNMSRLNKLREIVLLKIMEHLPLSDALNFRLTSSKTFQVSLCKPFYNRVQIRLKTLSEDDLELFKKLFDHYGKCLKLNVVDFDGDLKLLLPYIRNVEDVIIALKHLPDITRECLHVKSLVVNINGIENQEEDDNSDELDFTSFSQLQKLVELTIDGVDVNKEKSFSVVDKSLLHDIFANTTSISKISFNGIHIEGRDQRRHRHDGKLKESLRKLISTSSHIKEWSLNGVHCDHDIFEFPCTITSLECRNVSLVCLENLNSCIRKLIMEGTMFVSKLFDLPNLEKLELTGDFLHEEIEVSSCPHLKELYLRNILCFEKLQPFFTSSLQTLTLDSIDIQEETMKVITSKCTSLKKLNLENKKDLHSCN